MDALNKQPVEHQWGNVSDVVGALRDWLVQDHRIAVAEFDPDRSSSSSTPDRTHTEEVDSVEPAQDLSADAGNSFLLESVLSRMPPEGQAWLNGLNPFCRWALEHDLRFAGPDIFVKHWESLRDTLQKLERDFGPSDNWK